MKEKEFISDELEREVRRTHRVTPSNIDPWFGSWHGEARFTVQQVNALAKSGLQLDEVAVQLGHIQVVEVHVSVSTDQVWRPFNKPLWRRVLCPVVGKHGERPKVVSPSGMIKHVYPDGSLTKSRGGRARGVR